MLACWLFFAIESLFVNAMLPAEELALSDSAYIYLIVLNSAILIFTIIFTCRDKNFQLLLIGGFLLRLFFLFWSEYCSDIFLLPNSGADEMTYYYNAMSNLVKDKEFTGYAMLFSWQAHIFGLSKLYGKFVNVLFSISAIMILRRILVMLDIRYNVRTKTLALACFLPNYAILSALLLRESIIVFLIAVSAYFLILWWKNGKFRDLLLSLLASIGAAWLHSGMITYTLGIICIAVSAQRTSGGHQFNLLRPRTILRSVIAFSVVLFLLMNLNLGITRYFRDADSLEDIVSIADAYEEGGSAYNANIVSNDSTLGFIINTPFRMFYFLFSPVPWNWRSATDAIAFFFSALFYGYVFIRTLPHLTKKYRFSLGSALFLIALLTIMMFGWGVSNSGTALRHRDKMVIHYLIMYALLANEKYGRQEPRQIRSCSDEI